MITHPSPGSFLLFCFSRQHGCSCMGFSTWAFPQLARDRFFLFSSFFHRILIFSGEILLFRVSPLFPPRQVLIPPFFVYQYLCFRVSLLLRVYSSSKQCLRCRSCNGDRR